MFGRFKNHQVLQLSLLLLLVVSFLGPWTYEADGVPPPEWCEAPHVLLTPQRCVKLVSGAEMFGFTAYFFQELARGAFNNQPLELREVGRVILLILIISLPVLPLLVLTWRVLASFQPVAPASATAGQLSEEHARAPVGRVVLCVTLALGWLAALGMFLLQWPPQPWLFWGLWLYLLVNDAILMLNVFAHSASRTAPQTTLG